MTLLMLEILVAATTGLLSHWCFFIHGEHDVHAATISRAFVAGIFLTFLLQWRSFEETPRAAVTQTAAISGAYFSALVTSIVTYRLFFSPLKRFSGPLALKVTKVYHFWAIRRSDNYRFVHHLHKQYGDIVRTGPNELTLYTKEAFYAIYGPESSCTRGVFYDSMLPLVSLLTTRDPDIHAQWRKVWDQAFSMRALENLEPTVYSKAHELLGQLEQRLGEQLNIADWFERYTFDLMGLVCFDIEFNLTRGDKHSAVRLYTEGHKVLGPIAPVPWLLHLLFGIPGAQRDYIVFRNWAEGELRKMCAAISWVIDDARENGGVDANWGHLLGEVILFITAGSDPMHQNLTNIVYYLANEPRHLHKIREELSTIGDLKDYKALQQLTHLNAVINETLRLNPPVPCAGLRITPPEGVQVNGTHIPANTTVLVPHYTLCRRKEYFIRPNDFIPERFSTRPELIIDKSAWMPWSTGKYNCIGKNFGLMEIRIAVALLVDKFDISLAPGEDGREMFDKTLDLFTCVPGPLRVVLTERRN